MDKREDWMNEMKLPQASDAFTDAILSGGERIRRYERRRRRVVAAAASLAVLALAASLLLGAFRRPHPDNVAVAAPSQTVAPTGTPEPSGLDDRLDGALESYSWLKVVGAGVTEFKAGDSYEGFMQRPDPGARSIPVAVGTLVTYLGDAGNGYAKVRFAGVDGYMLFDCLREPGQSVPMYVHGVDTQVGGVDALEMTAEPGDGKMVGAVPRHACVEYMGIDSADETAGTRWAYIRYGEMTGWVDSQDIGFFRELDDWKLTGAKLTVNDAIGDVISEELSVGVLGDWVSLAVLETLIREAQPGVLGQCPQGALLVLSLRDGNTLTFTMPTDGCGTLLCENLAVYDMGADGAMVFWRLFPDCAQALGIDIEAQEESAEAVDG